MNSVTKLLPASRDTGDPKTPTPTGPGNLSRASREQFRLAMNDENDLIAYQSPETRRAVKVTLEALQHPPEVDTRQPDSTSPLISPPGTRQVPPKSQPDTGATEKPVPPPEPTATNTRYPGNTPPLFSPSGTRQVPPKSQPDTGTTEKPVPPPEPTETHNRNPGSTPTDFSTRSTRQVPPQSQARTGANESPEPPPEPTETHNRNPGSTPTDFSTRGTR